MLLCCFHFDESLMLNMLTDYKKDGLLAQNLTAAPKTKRMVEAVAA
jgi:hypothetical protein